MEDVQQLIAEHFGLDSVNQFDHLVDDLGADQLDTIELVMLLEERLNIDLSDDEVEELHTVQDVQECVTKKIK
jgi:acyl carrier protein